MENYKDAGIFFLNNANSFEKEINLIDLMSGPENTFTILLRNGEQTCNNEDVSESMKINLDSEDQNMPKLKMIAIMIGIRI